MLFPLFIAIVSTPAALRRFVRRLRHRLASAIIPVREGPISSGTEYPVDRS
jgi:hypothetical protein